MSSGRDDERGGRLALAGLVVYVALLAVGIFAEAFEISSILAWPIY